MPSSGSSVIQVETATFACIRRNVINLINNQEIFSFFTTNRANHLGFINSINQALIESEKLLDQIEPLTKK